ncbi:MAG: hypothetical protein ACKVTZ_16290 [Bacteroidia bacterium]
MLPSKSRMFLAGYKKLPIGVQIALPIVLILAVKFIWSAASTLISLGIIAVIGYAIFEFVRRNSK